MSAPPEIVEIVNETPADGAAVLALIDRAFGPGRFAKAAERLREGATPRLDLSFVAWRAGAVVGCVRLWPVRLGDLEAILLGPIAVDPDQRSQGLGARLIRWACQAADAAGGGRPIVLVGDEPYFGPFGFAAAPQLAPLLPGPVDPRRLLIRGDVR